MSSHRSPSAQRCALFTVAALLVGILVGPHCEPGVLARSEARLNGVVFEYDARTGRLSARIDESSDIEAVAIPNWTSRLGFFEQTGKRVRLDGYPFGDTEDKEIFGWYPEDIVVLRAGMRVEYEIADVPGDIHVRVDKEEYGEDARRLGVPLWSGEVVVRRLGGG